LGDPSERTNRGKRRKGSKEAQKGREGCPFKNGWGSVSPSDESLVGNQTRRPAKREKHEGKRA